MAKAGSSTRAASLIGVDENENEDEDMENEDEDEDENMEEVKSTLIKGKEKQCVVVRKLVGKSAIQKV